jgi:D-alanyl-D-alanine carboxypeptidase
MAVPQLLVDETANEIILARDSDNLWHPASLTKLMTVHLAFTAIETGKLSLQTPVVISENAASKPPSKLGIAVGKSIPLDQALRITITRSMNDLATAIGETVAQGSEQQFVSMMNAEAKRIGMLSTHFTNASGLPDDDQVTTARDLALLAVEITRRHGQFDSYFSTERLTYGSRVLTNTNTLLTKLPGTDGMKTGYVCSSGFNLINRITIKGRRYITVVMGAASVREREMMTGRMLSLVAKGPYAGVPLHPANAFETAVPDMSRYGCGKNYQAGKQAPKVADDTNAFAAALKQTEDKAKPPAAFVYGYIGSD